MFEFVFLLVMIHLPHNQLNTARFTQTTTLIGDVATALSSMRKLVSTQSPKARWTGSSNLIFGV